MEKKKIEKSIESIEKQKEKHREKVEGYDGKNYALIDYGEQREKNFVLCPIKSNNSKIFWYWEKEIEMFDNKIRELKDKLEKK